MSRGDLGEHYADALSYAVALANKPAFDRHMIHGALMRHDLILDYQAQRGVARAQKLAHQLVDRAVARVEMHPPELWRFEVPDRIRRYRLAADSRRWPGRTGPMTRRALEAVYLTAFIAKSSKFHLAARTWGLRAGMPAMNASRSAKRLQSEGLLRLERRHTATIASAFRVLNPRTVTRGLPPREAPLSQLVSLVNVGVHLLDPDGFERRVLAHDAFRPRALGDEGWMIARWLDDDEPILAERLSTSTGIKLTAVNQTLAELAANGAAESRRDGWCRTLEPDFFRSLDRIAAGSGTAGTLERERARYAEERSNRDRGLEERQRSSRSLFVTVLDPRSWLARLRGSVTDRGIVAHAA